MNFRSPKVSGLKSTERPGGYIGRRSVGAVGPKELEKFHDPYPVKGHEHLLRAIALEPKPYLASREHSFMQEHGHLLCRIGTYWMTRQRC